MYTIRQPKNPPSSAKILQNRAFNTVIDSMDCILISGSDQSDNLTNQIRRTKNEPK